MIRLLIMSLFCFIETLDFVSFLDNLFVSGHWRESILDEEEIAREGD